MLKSATTTMLGFILMATLIMLVPIANTNLFSDAMATVAMKYDDYTKYMGDSDGYRIDYY